MGPSDAVDLVEGRAVARSYLGALVADNPYAISSRSLVGAKNSNARGRTRACKLMLHPSIDGSMQDMHTFSPDLVRRRASQ